MKVETQFSIFLINKPGVLAAVTEALAAAKVNLMALSLSDSGEHGVLRIVADDAEKTRAVLRETHDRWTETDVLVVTLENHPGSFARFAEKLSGSGVNITYAYFTAARDGRDTTAVFKVPDAAKATDLLR